MTCTEYMDSYRALLADVAEVDGKISDMESLLQRYTQGYGDLGKVRGGNDRKAAEAALGDLVRQKSRKKKAAEERRAELEAFIETVGEAGPEGERHRRLLRMYYCDLMTWAQIRKELRPIYKTNKGKVAKVDVTRKKGISETAVYRIRLDAMAKAERAYRKWPLRK